MTVTKPKIKTPNRPLKLKGGEGEPDDLILPPEYENRIETDFYIQTPDEEIVSVMVDGNIEYLKFSELEDIVVSRVASYQYMNDEQAMETLKNVYSTSITNVKNDPELQKKLMKESTKEFVSIDMKPEIDVQQMYGGRKSFEAWEEDMMKCTFEYYLVTALTYVWIPEWYATRIAYYVSAFFRGVVGVTWAIIKTMFSFLWNNKVALIIYLASFSRVMSMFKPIEVHSGKTVGPLNEGHYTGRMNVSEIVQRGWENEGNTQYHQWKNFIWNQPTYAKQYPQFDNVTNVGQNWSELSSVYADEIGMKPELKDRLISYINGVMAEKPIDNETDFDVKFPGVWNIFVENAKRMDEQYGYLPDVKVAGLNSIIESYNYFLGGHVSDYVSYVKQGVNNAYQMWKHGWVSPVILSESGQPSSNYYVEKAANFFRMDTGGKVLRMINLDNLINVLALGSFVILSGVLALDLGNRMWNEISSVELTCARGQKINKKRMDEKIRKDFEESRIV